MSFLIMVVGIIVISALTMLTTQNFLKEYHVLATRVSRANRMYPVAKEDIETEAYYLVAGRQTTETTILLEEWEYLNEGI